MEKLAFGATFCIIKQEVECKLGKGTGRTADCLVASCVCICFMLKRHEIFGIISDL